MQRTFGREVALIFIKALVVVLTIIVIVVSLGAFYESGLGVSDGVCNVAVLPVEGEIWPFYGLSSQPLVTTPDMIEQFLSDAEDDSAIEAVLVEINSPGGLPAASERIAYRIKGSSLPTVGLIGDFGASGGYMIAAATDHLIASPMSTVGSIGVNMSYLENSKQNEEDGLTYVQLIAGEHKDYGSPDRPLTEKERELLQRDLDDVHSAFISLVANFRNLPLEKVTEIADGTIMTGTRAKEAGLVDGVGGRHEARAALATILGKDASEIIFCEYEAPLIPL